MDDLFEDLATSTNNESDATTKTTMKMIIPPDEPQSSNGNSSNTEDDVEPPPTANGETKKNSSDVESPKSINRRTKKAPKKRPRDYTLSKTNTVIPARRKSKEQRIWTDMRQLQRADQCSMQLSPFRRLIREILSKQGKDHIRLSKQCVILLKEASQQYISEFFGEMQLSVDVNSRRQPTEADLYLAKHMMQRIHHEKPSHVKEPLEMRYDQYPKKAILNLAGQTTIAAYNLVKLGKLTTDEARDERKRAISMRRRNRARSHSRRQTLAKTVK